MARAERRLVTVLFADVSGFTALCENLDAEDVALTMNRVFIELTDVIEAHGGVVDKYLGDAIMALFGAPRAWGDDAERAARAGLAMIEAVDRLGRELEPVLGRRLAMRIGINTGLVVAGMLGGRGYERYTVMGDAVNLASRMESASSPGRLLASGNTLRFLGGRFALEDQGLVKVKGKSEPVRAAFVLREERAGLSARSHAVEGVAIPFVGREREVRELVAAARGAFDGRAARALVVHGPSGVGKTRLLEYVAAELGEGGARLLLARDRAGDTDPLASLVDALGAHFGEHAGSVVALLEAMGCEADDEIAAHVAALVARILARDRSVPIERSTVVWGLAEFLAAFASRAPIAVFVEDARHGDRAFGEFLEALRERGVPIAVFFDVESTAGGEAVVRRLAALPGVVTVELAPLAAEDVRGAVRALLANVDALDGEIIERCVAVSEGFPFFAVEYVRTLFALGVLSVNAADGRWTVVRERLTADVLPASVQIALQAEIDHLPTVAREYVQIASIGDGSFFRAVVEELLVVSGSTLEEARAAERELARVGVVQEVSAAELTFRSGRFHRAAYEAQLLRTRRARHRAVGAALEGLEAMDSRPLAIAEHFLASDQVVRAVPHLLRSLEASIARYDLDGAERARAAFEDLAKASPDAVAAVDVAEWRASSAQLAHMRGELDHAIALAEEVDSMHVEAATRGESNTFFKARRVALSAGGRAHFLRGSFDASRAWYERAYAASLEAGAHASGEATVLDTLVDLANVALKQKRFDDVEELVANGRARAEQLRPWGDSLAIVMARYEDTEGLVRLARKEFGRAQGCFEASHRLRLGRGNPILMTVSKGNLAIAHHGLGRKAEAIRAFEEVLALRRTFSDPSRIAITLLNLAELEIGEGELERASGYLAEVSAIIERMDLREYRAVCASLAESLEAARQKRSMPISIA
jgi:class 3 adenylate cyclase/tetratricopeptide (TPR) repeat protein